MREDLARAGVDVGHGDGLSAERALEGDVDAAVPGAEAHVSQRADVDALLPADWVFGVEVAGHEVASASGWQSQTLHSAMLRSYPMRFPTSPRCDAS